VGVGVIVGGVGVVGKGVAVGDGRGVEVGTGAAVGVGVAVGIGVGVAVGNKHSASRMSKVIMHTRSKTATRTANTTIAAITDKAFSTVVIGTSLHPHTSLGRVELRPTAQSWLPRQAGFQQPLYHS